MNSLLDALGYIGGALDKPGRAVRGLLGGRPDELLAAVPFSDALGLTDEQNAVSGRGLLEHYGLVAPKQEGEGFGLADALGMGTELALDPLNYLGGLGLGKLAKANQLAEETNTLRVKNLVRNKQIEELLNAGAMPEEIAGLTKVRNEAGPVPTYHGTPRVFGAKPDFSRMNPDGLYGPGYYTTESPEVASSYAKLADAGRLREPFPFHDPEAVRTASERAIAEEAASWHQQMENIRSTGQPLQGNANVTDAKPYVKQRVKMLRDLGEGRISHLDPAAAEELGGYYAFEDRVEPRPNVRQQFLDIRNPFDMDRIFRPEEVNSLSSKLVDFPGYFYPGSKGVSGHELYGDLADALERVLEERPDFAHRPRVQSALIQKPPVAEVAPELRKQVTNELLDYLGYDGITHLGGGRAGGGDLLHQVHIAFDPGQVYHPLVAPALREVPELARQRRLSPLLAALGLDQGLARSRELY